MKLAEEVSRHSVFAAVCAYLMIGVVFAHLYCLMEMIAPGSFAGNAAVQADLHDRSRRLFMLGYFSLSTLTTVSFGDIFPGNDSVRALAMIEAATGQLFIVVLISTLVGQRVAQMTSADRNEESSTS